MDFYDKINNEDFLEEKEIFSTNSDEPTGIIKKGLSFTAKIALSVSKKVINKIVSNYRPPIAIKCITKKEDIISFIDRSLKNNSRDRIELREIALNNIDTIEFAKDINDELIKEYHEKLNEFKDLFSESQELNSTILESEKCKSTMKILNEIKSNLDKNSEFRIKYDIIKNLKECHNEFLVLSKKISSLIHNYPDWDNPIIAEYLVNNIPDLKSKEKIIYMLLSYYPTNVKYLRLAEKISKKEDSVLFSEMIKLFC